MLSYGEAISADPTGRLDSSFFERRFLNLRRYAETWDRLDLHAEAVVCGPFGSNLLNENYVEHGIPMIRPFNLRSCRVDSGEIALLEEAFVASAGLKSFGQGTVMFARVGEIGAGVCTYERATISPNIIAAELRDSINAYFVGVFANTKYGRTQLEAGMKVVAQPTISTDSIRALRVPRLSNAFQQRIEETFMRSVQAEDDSCLLLVKAENTLQHALGLDTWTQPEALSYVRSSNEAFAAGRLDAEHYQPRFAALLALIDATGHGAKLGDCLTENKRGKQPDYADAGLPVVNSKHVLRNDVRLDADNGLATFAVDDLLLSQGDALVNGTGVGTIGRTAAYLHECQAVPDNHVTILRPNKDLDPVYLSMFLNSIAGQFQVEQRLRGSSGQIELYPNDIAEFRVWVAPKALQQSIRKQVEHSFAQKQRATQLLDAAKRAVEIAIEDSEAAALAYLQGVA